MGFAHGEPVGAPQQNQHPVREVAWSLDETRVVAGWSEEDTATVWDWRTGYDVTSPLQHIFPVLDVAWSPDGTRVATGSGDAVARLWDVPLPSASDATTLADLVEMAGRMRVNDCECVSLYR